MTQTMTALYDTLGAAEAARDELIALGIADSEVFVRSADTEANTGLAPGTEDKGFWASLGDLFMPDKDRYAYSEGIRRGGYLLSVRVPDGLEDRAVDVMERSGPIDLDERTETWRGEGWTGGTSATSTTGSSSYASSPGANAIGTAGYADTARTSAYADTTAFTGTAGTEATVQLTEEELKVGKRQAAGGLVRVRTYVVERPVEEQVDLHSERVTIERRPVDQEVVSGVAAFQERTIEAVERGEEVVVSKTARVKEEIALHKDVETQTEMVRDTVRSMDVEIEDDRTGHGLGSTDPTLPRDKT
ncbi:YsnF/AvaK domain-containing protein [Geminicoccus harenae]|uniref:YsnF/AvaK domain-containing protein n=3 Tax=Geminicoccus TaxID=489140 RepID=UPI001C9376B2|nr:YsnF/AvaK domain-containing protein [Geminicoccus harenae]